MKLNRQFMLEELDRFIGRVFELPETVSVTVRGAALKKGEDRTAWLSEAVDRSYHDYCSDIDLSVTVSLPPADAVSAEAYLRRMDRYGVDEKNCLGFLCVPDSCTCRIVMRSGMRYDLKILFVRDENSARIELEPLEQDADGGIWPIENVNRFWFMMVQALGKLYRRDYLIGSHLANMCLNETLVQQMVIRDIQYGTRHHRYGHEEEIAYMRRQGTCPIRTGQEAFDRIADMLYAAALTYDELMKCLRADDEGRLSCLMRIWMLYEEGRLELGGMQNP